MTNFATCFVDQHETYFTPYTWSGVDALIDTAFRNNQLMTTCMTRADTPPSANTYFQANQINRGIAQLALVSSPLFRAQPPSVQKELLCRLDFASRGIDDSRDLCREQLSITSIFQGIINFFM